MSCTRYLTPAEPSATAEACHQDRMVQGEVQGSWGSNPASTTCKLCGLRQLCLSFLTGKMGWGRIQYSRSSMQDAIIVRQWPKGVSDSSSHPLLLTLDRNNNNSSISLNLEQN